jgi:NDP-sugar pyrophosphorylase family protein
MAYSQLNEKQVAQLSAQRCTATDWRQVRIAAGCDVSRINDAHFSGTVRIGDNAGTHSVDGVELHCGIYGASVANCDIGDHVRIANIGSVLSNYLIGNNVVIQDVAAVTADANATFGNGVELETVNEGGGRGVRIINDLTSQTAYVQAMLRHNSEFIKKLEELFEAKVKEAKTEQGRVGDGARVLHCGVIRNVTIGPHAFIHGAQFLENGTLNSCIEHPTEIGEGVQAKSFILSEGARVESGAILDKVFAGQNVKMGKQYSAENSLFFANCEAFHGEAVSLFAGPYTVTHHKSTLLIAGLFSFYNAGSGTNQSNHMYKLGPVHQGVLERGSKTGSFSYLLFEAHIGAFGVVIGKHYSNLDLPNLPFSYIFEEAGASKIVPALNLVSVGTVRDGEKWPKRDGRNAPRKRDLIVFDVFSPYTVEKMRRGRDELRELSGKESKDKLVLSYGGAQISRQSLEKGVKRYSLAVNRYLIEKVMEKIRDAASQHTSWHSVIESLKPVSTLRSASDWQDLAGLLTPRERLAELESQVVNGSVGSYDALLAEFQKMYDGYRTCEWQYVFETYAKEFGVQLTAATKGDLLAAADMWEEAAGSLQGMILEDSKKEFGDFAHIGYGLDQFEENKKRDFESVRGTSETNSVVQKLAAEGATIGQRKDQFKALVASIRD